MAELAPWAGVRWASILPFSFFTSFIHSVPACLVPPGPISLFLLSIPFFFPFFIFLPLVLLPFHPLSLPAPPPQLLWQQLNARNKGRIQLGHSSQNSIPGWRGEGWVGADQPNRGGPGHTLRVGSVSVCVWGGGTHNRPQNRPAPGRWLIRTSLNLCQACACAFSKIDEAPTPLLSFCPSPAPPFLSPALSARTRVGVPLMPTLNSTLSHSGEASGRGRWAQNQGPSLGTHLLKALLPICF